MSDVRSAIHVRTGQRAVVEALDAWLARHGVTVTPFDDVYDACVYLLRQYEHIPDLALLGADWLADDEFALVACLRQTWPRTAIVVYGGGHEAPRLELTPLTRVCRTEAAVRELLAAAPADVLRQLLPESAPLLAPAQPAPVVPLVRREINGLPPLRSAENGAAPGGPAPRGGPSQWGVTADEG